MAKQNGKKAYDFAMRVVGIVKNGGSYYSRYSSYRGVGGSGEIHHHPPLIILVGFKHLLVVQFSPQPRP